MRFWVELSKLGLGFLRRRREKNGAGGERRKRKNERNEKIRVKSLLYKALDRVDYDPIQRPTLQAVWSRSWWIRINPTPLMRSGDPDPSICVGLGRVPKAFCFSFQFLDFFAMCTPVIAVRTPCAFNFFIKIPKKLLCVLDMFLTVCWYFYMFKTDENNTC